jgi:MarR family transcriptional regulator, organic hydroperoxide resistance regulator
VRQPPSSIVHALEAATHRLLAHTSSQLSDLNLTTGELNVLAQYSAQSDQLTVAQLVTRTGQRRSTLTGILDRLERGRFVRRRTNPRDRRSFVVCLTARGRRAADRVVEVFTGIDNELRSRTTARAVNGFFEVLAAAQDLSDASAQSPYEAGGARCERGHSSKRGRPGRADHRSR